MLKNTIYQFSKNANQQVKKRERKKFLHFLIKAANGNQETRAAHTKEEIKMKSGESHVPHES